MHDRIFFSQYQEQIITCFSWLILTRQPTISHLFYISRKKLRQPAGRETSRDVLSHDGWFNISYAWKDLLRYNSDFSSSPLWTFANKILHDPKLLRIRCLHLYSCPYSAPSRRLVRRTESRRTCTITIKSLWFKRCILPPTAVLVKSTKAPVFALSSSIATSHNFTNPDKISAMQSSGCALRSLQISLSSESWFHVTRGEKKKKKKRIILP